ncbi:MAG TPA: tRNA (adenosine(37)-N6)-threonylcarbamoyltransferase complex dimerization subunit type 1 TsaB [Candidatus Atribacteria bacterium]|nr:tRNA (adenosine(37)-N6)-threonylcarbamoyltransferase complex dimerization subunit type 1 TsaB [Candidatus Atribacteria bacterium]HPT78995.1 tRNA (adenosine(37)-N6)-threonylcarbamoyltransferase complex dimerization subunit type 1 TsaB [Candidatus Atribacteria bacterium]
MKILALEASSVVAGVAIMDNLTLVYEAYHHHKLNHSQTLMPMVEEALLSTDLVLHDIDVIAVSNGPGSFTGLRIGIATVKGLAHAAGIRIAAVPTLDVLAYNIMAAGRLVCPILDARRDQVYTCLYQWDTEQYKSLMPYSAMPVDDLAEAVKGFDQPVVFVGDGVFRYKQALKDQLGESAYFAPPHLCCQRASATAWLGHLYAQKGMCVSHYELEPFYLRKSQAEQKKLSGGAS